MARSHRVVPRDDARAALVLLQLMPVAFLFRIRANHEYLMLVGLLVTLVGLEKVRQSWWARRCWSPAAWLARCSSKACSSC